MLLAWTRDFAQGLCGMLAHQNIFDHRHNFQFLPHIAVNSFQFFLSEISEFLGLRWTCSHSSSVRIPNVIKGLAPTSISFVMQLSQLSDNLPRTSLSGISVLSERKGGAAAGLACYRRSISRIMGKEQRRGRLSTRIV